MPMKRVLITTALLAAVFTVFAQSQIFPIWFEDAAGNKDTLWFGYDLAATNSKSNSQTFKIAIK